MLSAVKNMNLLGKRKIPFFFLIDFEMKRPVVIPLSEINSSQLIFEMDMLNNAEKKSAHIEFEKQVIGFEKYKTAFEHVQKHLHAGNSYLLNLTFPSLIETDIDLNEIFTVSHAKYKLKYRDEFVCFSPETFVKIQQDVIYSYPMKGTIDAALVDAENVLIQDFKEIAEHNTIVDLIRNDLSMVAKEVRLIRYRFIDKICTNNKTLLQVSSEISGKLPPDWRENIGNILEKILPAGSVSGAPKAKTLEIIRESENYDRGYYTGIFGVFDGENLDSAVAIRFIEKINGRLYYKSGGGITVNSELTSEYNELIDKIYVPVN